MPVACCVAVLLALSNMQAVEAMATKSRLPPNVTTLEAWSGYWGHSGGDDVTTMTVFRGTMLMATNPRQPWSPAFGKLVNGTSLVIGFSKHGGVLRGRLASDGVIEWENGSRWVKTNKPSDWGKPSAEHEGLDGNGVGSYAYNSYGSNGSYSYGYSYDGDDAVASNGSSYDSYDSYDSSDDSYSSYSYDAGSYGSYDSYDEDASRKASGPTKKTKANTPSPARGPSSKAPTAASRDAHAQGSYSYQGDGSYSYGSYGSYGSDGDRRLAASDSGKRGMHGRRARRARRVSNEQKP